MNTNRKRDRLPSAVVIGLESMTGLQTARLLSSHSIPVVGITRDPRHAFCHTNACERVIAAETGSDCLVEELVRVGRDLGEKSVLYPCSDAAVANVSRNRSDLSERYHIALPSDDIVQTLMDKSRFNAFAMEHGLPVAQTFSISSFAQAERAAEDLRFPCLLKPAMKSPAWEKNSKAKACRVADRQSFLEAYERCCRLAGTLIAQEWIEGPDSNLYSCNCYFSKDSVPLVTFVARKLRQWPPEAGTSCLGEECRNDVVLEQCLKLFQHASFYGLGYVEVKRDSRDGRYVIIEPNVGRPTGRSAIAEAGGTELLYTMYCDLLGRQLPSNRQQQYGNAKWIYLRRDLQSAFYYWTHGQLTVMDWLHSLQGIRRDAIFSWSDPKPFFLDVTYAAATALRGPSRPLA
jgi:D-aspartate ligase